MGWRSKTARKNCNFGENLGSWDSGSGNWSKIRDAYNEIYGEDSWEIDWELSNSSLLDYGNSTELLEFLRN